MTMAEGGTMTGTGYTLVIGDKNYSSWSLRPWLALKACGAAFEEDVRHVRELAGCSENLPVRAVAIPPGGAKGEPGQVGQATSGSSAGSGLPSLRSRKTT